MDRPRLPTAGEGRRTPLRLVRDAPAETPPSTRRGVSGFVRAHPAISTVTTVVALGLVPSLAWEVAPHGEPLRTRTTPPDPRYASQAGSLREGRASHIKALSDEDVESAVETCGGVGIEHLANKYGLPPDAERVARRFASGYERALQGPVYRGCLHGLLEPGS
jgi:hypothetical protein